MKRLIITTMLLLASLPAAADHDSRFTAARGGGALVHQARRLDDASSALFRQVYARQGRSPLTREARRLADASREFRYQVRRGAPFPRLNESYRRVGERLHRLERRLDDSGRHRLLRRHRYGGPLIASLHDVDRAYQAAGSTLWRYAHARRDPRRADRREHGPFGDTRPPRGRDRDHDWRGPYRYRN